MRDRFLNGPGFPMPRASPLVQQPYQAGLGLFPGQLAAQHLGKQVVIPVPDPVLIRWDQEQVLSLQPVDELGGVAASGDRVTQRCGETLKDGSSQQELPDVGRLGVQHLFGEEVGDEPVVAVELVDEAVRRRVASQGQRGQVYAGRPALCSGVQSAQVPAVEGDPRHRGHQRINL